MIDYLQLVNGARALPGRLARLAAALEKGQAVAPLTEQAEALNDVSRIASSLTLVLLGMTPEIRATVLAWLIGPQPQSVSVKLSEPLELLEVRLQDRGYTLETAQTGRREFGNPEAFAAALAEMAPRALPDPSLVEPLRLGLIGPPPLRDLTVLVPGNPHLAVATPFLLSTIAHRAAVLVLAVPGDYAWSRDEAQAVAALAENTLALWPIRRGTAVGAGSDGFAMLRQLRTPLLPEVRLQHAQSAFLPEFIVAGPNHPLRQALTLAAHHQQCRGVLDMIADRCDTDRRQLESRQKREARLERAAEVGARELDLKALFDQQKTQFGEDLNRLAQTLRENGRRALSKTGSLGRLLEEMLASLQPGDLERETAHKTIRLSLKPAVLADFRRRLGKALRQQVDEDCVLIRDSLEISRHAIESLLAEAGASSRGFVLRPPDNRALWESLGEALQLDIKYRGELPRRGFWQRLAEGRRIVFVALMLLSLVGGFLGFNIRQMGFFGLAFLLLFVGAVFYTFSAWRKEEQENLDKEIDKVRENVAAEFMRVLGELLRDKQTRLQQVLDELKRDGNTRLDGAMKDAQLGKAQGAQAERRDAQAKLRAIEQRLKQLRPLGQEIGKLREEMDRLGRETHRYLVERAAAEAAQ